MPARDRKGPLGEGPMTGRRMGFCARDRYTDRRHGSRRPRFGRGFVLDNRDEEIESLKSRIAELEDQLDAR